MSGEHESVELVPDVTVEYLAKAVLVAALMAVLSQLSIQLPGGIPFSFQHFAVFLAALVLGPVWGGFSLGLYLLVGAAGAPVFSNATAGLGVLFGQTGGFLLGFLVAAVLAGEVVHRRVEPRPLEEVWLPAVAVAFLLTLVPIYAIGVPWMAEVLGLSLRQAANVMVPFAIGDVVKVVVATAGVAGGLELLRRQ